MTPARGDDTRRIIAQLRDLAERLEEEAAEVRVQADRLERDTDAPEQQ